MLTSAPFPVSQEWGAGLAATNAMTFGGIKSGDNLLAVISITSAGIVKGHAITDFTVGNGTLTAGTISLTGDKVLAIWTSAPAA